MKLNKARIISAGDSQFFTNRKRSMWNSPTDILSQLQVVLNYTT